MAEFDVPLSKVWLSLHRFSQNSHLLNVRMWKPPQPNFVQIDQEVWAVHVDIHLRFDREWTDFPGNHACLTTLCVLLPV
jgi:hypothetical protein